MFSPCALHILFGGCLGWDVRLYCVLKYPFSRDESAIFTERRTYADLL